MPSPQHRFKVGQQLYFVSRNGGPSNHYVKITKIGRKWIDLSNRERFDAINKSEFSTANQWFCDGRGYSIPGSVYLTIEDYRAEQRYYRLLGALANFFRQHRIVPSERLTNDRLAYVARLLGIKIDGELPPTNEFICEKCGLRTDAQDNTQPTF